MDLAKWPGKLDVYRDKKSPAGAGLWGNKKNKASPLVLSDQGGKLSEFLFRYGATSSSLSDIHW